MCDDNNDENNDKRIDKAVYQIAENKGLMSLNKLQ